MRARARKRLSKLQKNAIISKTILEKAGVDEKARGETLSPQRLAALSDVLLEEGAIKLK